MSQSSEEDFNKVIERMEKKRLERYNSICRERARKNRRRNDEVLKKVIDVASNQEQEEIEYILQLRKKRKQVPIGRDKDESTGNKNEDEKEEKERMEILMQLRSRHEYKKREQDVIWRIMEDVKDHGSARSRIRTILVILSIKRRVREELPCCEDLASHLFHGERGKPVSAWEQMVAVDMLVHTVRVCAVDNNRGRPLSDIQKTILKLEDI